MQHLLRLTQVAAFALIGLVFAASICPATDNRDEMIAQLGSHRFLQNSEIRDLMFTFSPEGSRVFAQDREKAILWQVDSGKRRRVFDRKSYVAGAMSRDGSRIVLAGCDSTLNVLDVETGKSVGTLELDCPSSSVAISDDGTTIASGEKELSQLSVWKLSAASDSKWKKVRHWERDDETVRSLRFSHARTQLVCAGSIDGKNLVYSLSEDEPIELEGGGSAFSSAMTFSPDGKLIAGTSQVKNDSSTRTFLRIWNSKTGKVLGTQKGDFNSVCFSPDGSQIVGSGLGTVKVFDVEPLSIIHQFKRTSFHIRSTAFSPDGKLLATAHGTRIRFWNTETWQEIQPGHGHEERSHLVEFSSDGKTIATASRDKAVILWSWPSGKERARIRDLIQLPESASSLSISPDSQQLLVSARKYDGKPFYICDLNKGTRTLNFGRVGSSGFCMFLSNGKEAVSSGSGGSLAIWNVATGKKACSVGSLRKGYILDTRPTNKGSAVWWAADNRQMGIRDLESGVDTRHLKDVGDYSDGRITLSPDNNWMAVNGQVWDLQSEEILLDDQTFANAISPDGQLLAIGKSTWEKRTRTIIHTFGDGVDSEDVHGEAIDAVTFSPDGAVLVTTGDPDSSVWDMTGLLSMKDRELLKLNLTNSQMESLWITLASDDGWKAHQAAWKFAVGGEKAVRFLAGKLSPATVVSSGQLKKLYEELAGENGPARVMAARNLVDLGIELTPKEVKLTRAINREILPANAISVEDAIAKGYDPDAFLKPAPVLLPLPDRIRESRAIAALERSPSSHVEQLLTTLSQGHRVAPLTKESDSALKRVRARHK